jgi:phage/plasmid-like protein (TIGR03299 family)
MAHQIDMSNNRANMAYVGDTPWHGLGQQLTLGAPIEDWKREAGMDFTIKPSHVFYRTADGLDIVDDRKVLFREDTGAALGIVSDRYQVVQPGDVLEFYRDLTEAAGFQLETAGVLFGGKRFWAQARIGKDASILGRDQISPFLLLATSCDASLSTVAQFTSVRVVCNNTLQMSVGAKGQRADVRVPHSRKFNAEAVKAELGIAASTWESFLMRAELLAGVSLTRNEAIQALADALKIETEVEGENIDVSEAGRTIKDILRLYDGAAKGAELVTAKGTAWGLVNAVTEWADHHRPTQTVDARLNRAWFGDGAALKSRIVEEVMQYA